MSIEQDLSPRRFVLNRVEDATGTSGTGIVAEGIEFSDGSVALRWRSSVKSTAVYETIKAVAAIHGHGGRTQVLWLDAEGGFRLMAPSPATVPPPPPQPVEPLPDVVDSEGGEA